MARRRGRAGTHLAAQRRSATQRTGHDACSVSPSPDRAVQARQRECPWAASLPVLQDQDAGHRRIIGRQEKQAQMRRKDRTSLPGSIGRPVLVVNTR
jgi:hypothetical protein